MEPDPFATIGWTAHASERLRERFPSISEWYALGEIRAALTLGRWRHTAEAGVFQCWVEDESRWYVLRQFGRCFSVLTVRPDTRILYRSGPPLRAGYAPVV